MSLGPKVTDGFGSANHWGFSPAVNLISLVDDFFDITGELNILIVGGCDARHILTLLPRESQQNVNVYVIEANLEAVARQLLLTSIALHKDNQIGLQEKVEIFLETFGNTFTRTTTRDYITDRANEFIKWMTDEDLLMEQAPIFNFSNLRYKEKDFLENIFKFWRLDDPKTFQVDKMWDLRLRNFLGTKFDTRENAYDWDYSMELKAQTSIFNWRMYKHWREYGVGFVVRDESAYEVANRTLASGKMMNNKEGSKVGVRGYWGDIVISPYLSYGIQSENKDLFKTANNNHVKTPTDISVYNLKCILQEIHTGMKYKECEKSGEVIIEEVEEEDLPDLEETEKEDKKSYFQDIGRVRIFFLSIDALDSMHKKSKFSKQFNMVFFSNSLVQQLKKDTVLPLLHKHSLIAIETATYMVGLKDELKDTYLEKIIRMASEVCCKKVENKWHRKEQGLALFEFEGTQ